jgi:O-antigen/teichoic acid export membrane protein
LSTSQEQYGAYVDRIARGAGISSFGHGIGNILNFATQIALARLYGAVMAGLFVLGFTVVQMASVLAQFGLNQGVLRYVAHYHGQRDVAGVRGTILLALWAAFALSTVFAALMFLGADVLADRVFRKPALDAVFRVFSVSLPFLTVMSVTLSATTGFQTAKFDTYVQYIQRPLLNLVLLVVLYLLGAEVLGAVVAFVLSMAVGSALALYYLRRIFPALLDRSVQPKFEPRSLFGTSAPLVVAIFAPKMNGWIVVLMLGALSSAESVGIFNAAIRTATLSTLVLSAFTTVFSAMVSNLFGRGELEDLDLLYRDVSRWTFTGSFVIFMLTVLLAKDVMAIFGPAFVAGWAVMIVVAAGQLINSSTGPSGRILAMTGYQRVVMWTTSGSTFVSLALSYVLIRYFGMGMMGAGVAVATGMVVSNALGLFQVKRLVGLWPYSRGYLKPLAAGLLAATAAYLVKLMLPLSTGIPTILIVAPIFMAGFVVLVLAAGLSSSDRQFLAALQKAVLRKVSNKAGSQDKETVS